MQAGRWTEADAELLRQADELRKAEDAHLSGRMAERQGDEWDEAYDRGHVKKASEAAGHARVPCRQLAYWAACQGDGAVVG